MIVVRAAGPGENSKERDDQRVIVVRAAGPGENSKEVSDEKRNNN